jgi:transglutaminase-like putative cysteine protease
VAEAKTPSAAAALLNQRIFPLLKIKYSTQRPKADQSPHESIRAGLASCTGLSVLLIDACRSVGVPARFAGTPLWTNKSGNHPAKFGTRVGISPRRGAQRQRA